MSSEYLHYLIHDCGWYTEVYFGDIFHVHETVCPRCGASVPEHSFNVKYKDGNGWKMRVARRIMERTVPFLWYKPSTWLATRETFEYRKD